MPENRTTAAAAALLALGRPFATSEVAELAGVSRQAAHKALKRLQRQGLVRPTGAGRAARWRGRDSGPLRLRFPRATLAEDRVWSAHLAPHAAVRALPEPARGILQYAATELLNNAIDHSGSPEVELRFEPGAGRVSLEVADEGAGLFEHVREGLGLPSELDAAAELTKGKVTTDPARHTGEGLFFTSKAVNRFEADSGGLRWLVDNDRGDTAIAEAPRREGTRVRVELAREPRAPLAEVFARYTDALQFARTEVVVRLFEHGEEFVSRSEARRLLHGLERFRKVTLDFDRVRGVGQGFADEVFRVWPAQHPGVELEPVRMAPPVALALDRARAR